MKWMIYGANGYTGELVLQYAKTLGEQPVLAGRNRAAIEALAEQHQLPACVVDLADTAGLQKALADVDLVVHCAGPFDVTAKPMIEACLQTKTHYLDITGELNVFEYAHSRHDDAVRAGIVLCPGVGFDVIPTDCVAAQLKEKMHDATHLTLGFDSASRMSRGTAKTSARKLGDGGAVRKDGKITSVPLAYRTRKIDFGGGEKLAMTIPWGDVSTAYHTTAIPNIEVYIPASPRLVKRLQRMNWFRWLLRMKPVQRWLEKKIEQQPAGPDQKQLENATTHVWGEARNQAGQVETLRLEVLNGYKLTSRGAVDVAMHVLGNQPAGGFYTPSKLCGAQLVNRYVVDR
ncbi:saccharopine dehydrogenase family protein [Pseudidiomarina aestuarii]|uniref:saccharopine dehydrogenase family protein n=1 Tax=Pseudidiomarina aestuarii TaxID=624146 RepID=UPI003A9699D7